MAERVLQPGRPLLIRRYGFLASATAPGSPKELFPAIGTSVASYLGFHPFFRSHLAPLRHSPQNYLTADWDRKIIDVFAGKCVALVTSFIAPFFGTGSDGAGGAVAKHITG
jgi:hypothetical protein